MVKLALSEDIKQESFEKFVNSGRNNSIKKDILLFLRANKGKSFTANELVLELGISYRTSVCNPLNQLVASGLVEVLSLKFDPKSNRRVSSYSLSPGLCA